jgi:hypothetical protein
VKLLLGELRAVLVEVMDDDADAYEAAKQSMIPVDKGQYGAIYQRLHDKLSPYESFTNTEENSRFGERHIYTLWGMKVKGEETPVISHRERGERDKSEHTYMANPKFLATNIDPEGF